MYSVDMNSCMKILCVCVNIVSHSFKKTILVQIKFNKNCRYEVMISHVNVSPCISYYPNNEM